MIRYLMRENGILLQIEGDEKELSQHPWSVLWHPTKVEAIENTRGKLLSEYQTARDNLEAARLRLQRFDVAMAERGHTL